MESEQNMADDPPPPDAPAWQARKLLRAARAATLATTTDGQPFAALVTPACAPDLSILCLLSSLSEHTRHLRADPRCALFVCGEATDANPQTAPRVTVTGLAEPEPDPALKQLWLARHPYAALYADFADFNLWRIRPRTGLLVGGFARATRLRQTDLTPDPIAVASIAEAAGSILTHCNADHADALAAIAGRSGPWTMTAVDTDGCDLTQEETVLRVPWSGPARNASDIRTELVQLARRARTQKNG